MDQLAAKISAYHLLSYLLTGVLLAVSYLAFHPVDIGKNVVIQFGIAYGVGLLSSRVGSLFLEWVAKRTKLVRYAAYPDYVRAEKADPKISGLAEQSAFFRTLATGYLLLAGLSMFDTLEPATFGFSGTAETLIYIGLSILFLLSYRKQSEFVFLRISDCGAP